MKKAQTLLEYALLFGVVAVISITVLGVMHSNKNTTKLTDMSKITIKK